MGKLTDMAQAAKQFAQREDVQYGTKLASAAVLATYAAATATCGLANGNNCATTGNVVVQAFLHPIQLAAAGAATYFGAQLGVGDKIAQFFGSKPAAAKSTADATTQIDDGLVTPTSTPRSPN